MVVTLIGAHTRIQAGDMPNLFSRASATDVSGDAAVGMGLMRNQPSEWIHSPEVCGYRGKHSENNQIGFVFFFLLIHS